MEKIIKTIDIEKSFRSSTSKLVRFLPKFIIRLLERIIWQDEMNATIHRSRHLTGVPFVNSVLNDWKVKVVIKGGEYIPKSGRFVFVANHPVGAIDSLSFLSTIYEFFPEVISPSNQLFNYIPNLHPVILGVNVFGANTKETAEKLNQLFESDAQVMIFPSGEVSRRKKGEISDGIWQKTFITKAIQYQRDIIPVHISGRNSGFFYFIANLRKFLGIKIYIETMLLPNEMMRQRNSTVVMTIGKPISWSGLTKERSQNEWAQFVKDKVYEIVNPTNQ
jgi:putative hemolysin